MILHFAFCTYPFFLCVFAAVRFGSFCLLPPAYCLLPAQDPAVDAGREALNEWWWRSYPWYDKAADAARPINVAEPWYMKLKFWEKFKWPDWPFGAPRVPSSLLEWAAWIGLGLVLAALVYMLVRAYRMRRLAGRKHAARAEEADAAGDRRRVEALPALGEGSLRPGDFLAEAARLYREGDYCRALVYLFSHQLIELDRRHLIRLAKGKTNRQYVRELGRAPTGAPGGRVRWSRPLGVLVEQTMVAFEDAFFGNYAIDRARFESCWRRMDEFDSLVAEASP